ncbi:MAG TPA: hypothetical protein VGY54_20615 [Polyangiaceae bacterium]|jgi:hypothetical protein|nr:hypothetical protein [Polyangiaceae bacterium]
MAKRTAKEVLDAIDAWKGEDALDAEMESILAMTPEERERELEAAGYDVQAEKAKARVWREKARRGELSEAAAVPPAPEAQPLPVATKAEPAKTAAAVIPLRPRPRSTLRVLTVMAAAAACILGVIVGVVPLRDRGHPDNVGSSPTEAARHLREAAFSDCDATHWELCLRRLDDARAIDPDGESSAKVKQYRQKAEQELRRNR